MALDFKALFQDLPNAYMLLDRELRYTDANRAYERLIDIPRESLIGQSLFDLFPGITQADGTSESDVLRASLIRVLETGERDVLALIPYTLAGEDTGATPEVRYWSASHEPVRDAQGNLVGILQHTSDVTEVEQLRQAVRSARTDTGQTGEQMTAGVLDRAASIQRDNLRLAARQNFLMDLFHQAPGFMAVVRGPDHQFELANTAYVAMVGRPVVGQTLRDALPELEGQGFFELLDNVRATGVPYVGRGVPVLLRDETGVERTLRIDFVYQPIRAQDGSVEAIFVQGADVTDREVLLTRLRDSEARFRAITELVPQIVWSTQEDGKVDYFNQRWHEVTGQPPEAAAAHGWMDVLHPEDLERVSALWAACVATGNEYDVEYRIRHADGGYRWWLARGVPVPDGTEGQVRWMGTCTDIDEIKRVQNMLEASQSALRDADQQKDQFLAMLAHELRNPLAPIVTATQILKMAPDSADSVRHAAGIIDRQTDQMRNLVEDLVDLSRVTRGLVALQWARTSVAAVIQVAVEQTLPLVTQREHQLTVEAGATDLHIDADPMRLAQIVVNLLNNAAKYTPPGGQIRLSCGTQGDELELRVSDNGQGMAPDLLERIFELFVQAETTPERHAGGLGLGLALSRRLAQMHGGRLTATSPGPGLGSTFELRVPMTRTTAD